MQDRPSEPFYDERDAEWQIGEYVPEFEYRDLDEPPEVSKDFRRDNRTAATQQRAADQARLRRAAAVLRVPMRGRRQGGGA